MQYGASAKAATLPGVRAEPRRDVDGVRAAEAASLPASVRAKLTPRLVQLLETDGVAAVPWLRLVVTVTDESAATIRQLEAAGLRVIAASGRTVTGVVERARLAALAAEPAVTSIDLAPPASSR
jgi:hypothetical protein